MATRQIFARRARHRAGNPRVELVLRFEQRRRILFGIGELGVDEAVGSRNRGVYRRRIQMAAIGVQGLLRRCDSALGVDSEAELDVVRRQVGQQVVGAGPRRALGRMDTESIDPINGVNNHRRPNEEKK